MNVLNKWLNSLGLSPIAFTPYEWIVSVIDIAIVAYVLYRVVKWIKDTRAWSLFKGLMLIIALFFVSTVFKLYTVQWIILSTINVGIIALIIIFQPELRKALEELGRGSFMSMFGLGAINKTAAEGDLTERSADEIVYACKLMAKVRTGALIVVGRKIGLLDLEKTGIEVDAAISKQLLINIFEDKTPLHDGAVIIRENRVAAATCIMPLTAQEIGSELGTRHRAAVGASETSDATVVVVSEETGVISIAQNGKLQKNVNDEQLYEALLGVRKVPVKRRAWKGRDGK